MTTVIAADHGGHGQADPDGERAERIVGNGQQRPVGQLIGQLAVTVRARGQRPDCQRQGRGDPGRVVSGEIVVHPPPRLIGLPEAQFGPGQHRRGQSAQAARAWVGQLRGVGADRLGPVAAAERNPAAGPVRVVQGNGAQLHGDRIELGAGGVGSAGVAEQAEAVGRAYQAERAEEGVVSGSQQRQRFDQEGHSPARIAVEGGEHAEFAYPDCLGVRGSAPPGQLNGLAHRLPAGRSPG